jgi:hypothetical protein
MISWVFGGLRVDRPQSSETTLSLLQQASYYHHAKMRIKVVRPRRWGPAHALNQDRSLR